MNYDYEELAPSPLSDFLIYLISIKGRSNKTVHEYYLDLRTFYKYLCIRFKKVSKDTDFDDIDINKITLKDLKRVTILDLHGYINFVDSIRNNNNKTKARKIASLRSYYRYMINIVTLINENPTDKLETPRSPKRLPVYLTLEESKKLLGSIDGPNKERNYALIVIFLNCGVRLSEIVGINIGSINFAANTLSVVGKGNKERTIYLNDACIKAIKNYEDVRPEGFMNNDDPLFLSNRKTRINQRTIQYMLEKYLKKCNLDGKHFSPHKLRHTAATLMYQYGNVDILALQDILGHESVSTTQIYTHINDKRLKEAVELNPLSNFIATGEERDDDPTGDNSL